ncbi:MAG TPA: hypothetical protein VHA75_04785 [Rugosimonospora sp.]|nr:hypothetical protein [Rugosimonospora sp.]
MSPSGLRRRTPQEFLPVFGDPAPEARTPVSREPSTERAELDQFTQGSQWAVRDTHQGTRSGYGDWRGGERPVVEPTVPPVPRSPAPPSPVAPVAPPPAWPDRPEPVEHYGLVQRRPGTHLAESARPWPSGDARPGPDRPSVANRDAEAERGALDEFVGGLVRAARHAARHPYVPEDPR